METSIPDIHTILIRAVVTHVATFETGVHHVRLLHEYEQIDAVSWLPPLPAHPDRVLKAEVRALPLDTRNGTTHVVTRITPDPDMDVFELIPDAFGQPSDIVERCREVVDACKTNPLRRFLSDVFSMSSVYHDFWTCPASRAHHHAFPGGLAQHSIEMAENVRDTPRLSNLERDVGIAFALLHDVGKLWCYAPDTSHMHPMGHELVGLAQLHPALERLAKRWPDGAVAMRSLLSGQWKHLGGKPLMAVASLVRAFDQSSAERDLRSRNRHPHRPWSPSSPDRAPLNPYEANAPVRTP
ncbi:TraI domain-containing protein [Dokdonella sp.]|uniref:TraI domain-containing protein n=1 Tax=Dokdonella sp. TaxID=2291710 RepID=UPI0025BAC36A|nr:TraI domain-containing protein [Dokdonella sp.]MBX3691737.1 hypothetical protein [Dokdonella sp.]